MAAVESHSTIESSLSSLSLASSPSSSASSPLPTTPSTSSPSPLIPRTVSSTIFARQTAEGLGATVRRLIGGGQLEDLDPFLLLDHAVMDSKGGFPDHPHRGFETVSYVLPWSKGTIIHEDFTGKKGELGRGDAQWMTAGRGIVHSEIPVGEGVEGIQLWINLSSKDKMVKPSYQDLREKDIPVVKKAGVEVRVISGEAMGIKSPTRTLTPTTFLHYTIEGNKMIEQSLPSNYNALIYVLKGSLFIGPNANEGKENSEEKIPQFHGVTLIHKKPVTDGKIGGFIARTFGGGITSFFLIAGQPLNEPIVRYGPFVMNTSQQIQDAFRDYQNGKGGFEKAKGWKSTIGTEFRDDYENGKKGKKGKKKGKNQSDDEEYRD